MKTIIKNGLVISMDKKRDKYSYEDVVIEDNRIIYVGNNYTDSVDKEIDASGKIVMPGLINCHTHLGMSIFRASNDNYSLDKWLKEYIWPIEDKMDDNDMYYTTLLSIIEMIKTGTTCFSDMYFKYKGSFKAFDKIKIRGMYGRCLLGDMDNDGIEKINEFKESVKDNKNNLIKICVCPHGLYTVSSDYLSECGKLASEYNLPIHIHLSENRDEVKDVLNKYNMKPVEVLDKYKILNHKVMLAHGTYIDDDEIELIKNKDVSICTNPISNLNLGCGIADISKYISQGINVCLGTDGVGSGNNMNMFYHMSMVDNLQKAKYEDSTIMDSYEVLKMATINGARALGLEDQVGSIEVGKNADIIIVDIDDIEMFPCIDPIIHIVHNGWYNSVDTTIVDGNILMEGKKLNIDVDIGKLKKEITSIRERLL